MEPVIGFFVLFALAVLVVPLVLSVTHASRLRAVESALKKFSERLTVLEAGAPEGGLPSPKEPVPRPVPAGAGAAEFSPPPKPPPAPASQPPPLPIPAPRLTSVSPPASLPIRPAIDWEAFMGVKLFAWIGGFVLFLGVVFLVKYSFENNLITPRMRIAIGALIGLSLVAAGWRAAKKNYRVPGQSLCATGILVLYADVYAAHAFYALISIVGASALMCAITAGALLLATHLESQSAVWLAALGGFMTPALLWTQRDNPTALFGYAGILNFGLATVATLKRWNYFLVIAAIGTVGLEIGWAADFFGVATADRARWILLLFETQFLVICLARQRIRPAENWSAIATALVAFAALIFCGVASDNQEKYPADFIYPILLFADAGLIAMSVARRVREDNDPISALIIAASLLLTWIAEWAWHDTMFQSSQPFFGIVWYVAIFLLFAAIPCFCGTKRLWSWTIAAIAGPLQFWFVYQLLAFRFPNQWMFLLPLAFAIPAAAGVIYLVGRERIPLASGDSRLVTQSAALLFFISLIFPVQFEREWITLGWALQGVALLLLFRRIPNRQLQVFSLLVLCAAFGRLALNPAVLEYHRRTPIRIWNWYLYAYGISAICFLAAARLFRSSREHAIERLASPLLYSLGAVVAFLLLNIEIADYFSIGPTLTFSFSGNFARDMTYSIAWALFAFALLLIGMKQKSGAVRYAGLALLLVTLVKLFLHDLGSLSQLYRIGAFIGVAMILIVVSFVYQRFLVPRTTESPPPPSA